MIEFSHIPVLKNETIDLLNVRQNGVYVDGTLGGAGHSKAILEKAKIKMLVGIDQDEEALAVAKKNLSNFKNYNFPEENSIKYELSTANISYYGNEEKLIKATQKIELKYSYIDEYAMAKIKNYCNAYNKIEDSYQLQCTFENNILTLNNNFFIQKLDTNIISTNNITIELYGNKSTNIEEIINQEIASGNICKEV